MTNREYFKSQLGFSPDKDFITASLIDAGLSELGVYIIANKISLKTAALSALNLLLTTPNVTQGSGETANSITYDRTAVLQRIRILEDELGLGLRPTIKGVQVW